VLLWWTMYLKWKTLRPRSMRPRTCFIASDFFLGMAAGNYHSCIAWFGELSMCIEFGLPNHLSGMNVKPFSP
jgi:hypothetical protein